MATSQGQEAGRTKPAADSWDWPSPTSTWAVGGTKGKTDESKFKSKFQGPRVQRGSPGKEVRWGPTQDTAACLTVTSCCVLHAPGTVLGISVSISFTRPRRTHPHLPERKRGWLVGSGGLVMLTQLGRGGARPVLTLAHHLLEGENEAGVQCPELGSEGEAQLTQGP